MMVVKMPLAKPNAAPSSADSKPSEMGPHTAPPSVTKSSTASTGTTKSPPQPCCSPIPSHVIRMIQEEGEPPQLDRNLFRRCFHAVSRLQPTDEKPTSMEKKDASLAASAEIFLRDCAGDTLTHRKGIGPSLEYAAKDAMANLQIHVKMHLPSRIEKWLAWGSC